MKNSKKTSMIKNNIGILLGSLALLLAIVALWLAITNIQIMRTAMEMEAEDDFQRAIRQSRYELCYEHDIRPCAKTKAVKAE